MNQIQPGYIGARVGADIVRASRSQTFVNPGVMAAGVRRSSRPAWRVRPWRAQLYIRQTAPSRLLRPRTTGAALRRQQGLEGPRLVRPRLNGLGIEWGSLVPGLIDRGFDITGQIIGSRPGTFRQEGEDVFYRQPAGSQQNIPFNVQAGITKFGSAVGLDAPIGGGYVIAAGAIILGVLVMGMGRRRR